jgi:hypothetical protein
MKPADIIDALNPMIKADINLFGRSFLRSIENGISKETYVA